MNVQDEYSQRFPVLQQAAEIIKDELRELLSPMERIDNITVRAKSIERFVTKATMKTYADPLQDIQDQIGARAIVYYLSDVDSVAKRILGEFRIVEGRQLEENVPNQFGYQARHYVCCVPLDIRTKTNCPIGFFELQISTLFQHAWAEANHDLGYKSAIPTSYGELRKIAWAAAQAWGADTIFDEIWNSRCSATE